MKVSEYYGLDMYSDKGYYIGEVQNVVLDFDGGEVSGLALEMSEKGTKMVPYQSVMAVGDIILVRTEKGKTEEEPEVEAEEEPDEEE